MGCPVCRHPGDGGAIRFDVGRFKIRSCERCETLVLSPLPPAEAVDAIYDESYYSGADGRSGYADYEAARVWIERTYDGRLRRVSGYLSRRSPAVDVSRLHEIGCAFGYGLGVAKDIFPEAEITGSDLSPAAVERCLRDGHAVHQTAIAPGVPAASQDLVFLFDVIEHLHDLPSFKKSVHEQLKAGGYMLLTTPDMDSLLNRFLGRRSPSIKVPEHLIYFSQDSLVRALLPEFELEESWHDVQYVGAGMLLNRLLHVAGLGRASRLERKAPFNVPVPNGMKLYLFRKVVSPDPLHPHSS